MSKSDANRYLDDDKKDLYTANNYYKYALQNMNNVTISKAQQGDLTPLAIANCTVKAS
ncbi:hypothetical protein RHORCCE3_0403 [Rickettsia hoogstraalii str. RCCE3]|uniref:hypothetical protein n=1 Tax=Rickettsia hoogstraalii TaxID=467174 RepID=UPI00061FD197|nr:hypothetical protein [Rickettsia hoogstraalii]KJV81221.1 hypothetical protein RHORCCE3_0403 [Rickettsia hoogstraalii str. RCCE3]